MSRGGYRRGVHHLPVESCHRLAAWGYFEPAQMWVQDDTFEIEWQLEDEWAHLRFVREGVQREQHIRLYKMPCNYGGYRFWFQCPSCVRKVGKVYLPETLYAGGAHVWHFLCRHCYRLAYLQRQDHPDLYWTYLHRAERIADRWLGEQTKDWIGKKKGQHWHTFQKRADQYEALIGASDQCFLNAFGKDYAHLFSGVERD